MDKLPEKITARVHIGLMRGMNGQYVPQVFDSDRSHLGYVMIGSQEIEVDVPDCNPMEAEIASLEQRRAQALAHAQAEASMITTRINTLKMEAYHAAASA